MARAAAALALIALLLPAASSAHPQLRPGFVEDGASADLLLTAPNERNVTMTGIELSVPEGVEVLEAGSTSGWKGTLAGGRASWSGGRVAPQQWARLPVRLRADAESGTATLSVRQLFADGRSVDWPVGLAVTPAPPRGGSDKRIALAAGAIGIMIAGSAAVVWHLRRRGGSGTLQEK